MVSVAALYLNPTFASVQCDQLVEQYEPVLVQLLLQMMDPDFVCMVNYTSYPYYLLSVNIFKTFVFFLLCILVYFIQTC